MSTAMSTSVLASIELPHRVQHRDNVFHGRTGLDVVNGSKDEPSAAREDFAAPQHLLVHLGGRCEWQSFLRIHTSTPEHDAVAKPFFELAGVHSRRGTLHGVQNVESSFDKGGEKLED